MRDDFTEDRASTEEFDLALGRGLMRGVWTAGASSVVVAFLSFCCGLPLMTHTAVRAIACVIALVAITSAAVSVFRLFGMPPEFREGLTGGQRYGSLALAFAGASLGFLQLLFTALWFVLT